jgi:hypothetical protein
MAERVVVRNQAGEPYTVDAAELDQALATGLRLETPEEKALAEKQEKYGTDSQAVLAGAEAAGRAATLGLSTPIQIAAGMDPEGIKARQDPEVNPIAPMVGTAIGIGLPMALSAGASAPAAAGQVGALGAARALAGASAPALISKAGQAVTKGVQAILPEAAGLGAKALGRAAAVGSGAALEGAAYGVGEVIHEAALGDPNLTAESALGTIGLSAAMGGGFGALAGVGEVAIPAALGKAREAVGNLYQKSKGALEDIATKAAEMRGTAPDVATLMLEHRAEVTALQRQVPGIADELTNATPEMVEWTLKNGERIREMETAFPGTVKQLARTSPETADYLLNNWQKVITDPAERIKVAKNLREGMQSVLDNTDDVLREMNSKFAPREAEALLATADDVAVKAGFESTLGKVDEAIAAMRAEPELHSGSMARHLEKVREGLVRDAGDRLNPLDAFNRLKTLRQSLDEAIPYGKNALGMGFSDRNSANVLKQVRRAVKDTLTDETVFGAAAARRAGLDDAQSEWLRLTQKNGVFKKAFLDSSGTIPSTKIDTWLNSLAKDKGVESAEAWGQLVSASKRVISEAEASFKSAPVGTFNRSAVDELVSKAAKMAEETQAAGKVTATMKYLGSGGVGIPNSGPFVPNVGMRLAGQAAEMLLPGAVTSAVKATINIAKTATSVPRMVSVLSALDAAGKAIGRQVDAAAGVLVRGSVKARNIGRSEAAAGIASSFGRTSEEAQATFLRRAKEIQGAAQPQSMMDALTRQTEGLDEHAPNTAKAMQAASARGVAFLQSKLPKPPNNGLLGPEWVPSQDQVSKFNRYYLAVDNPTAILKQAAAGTLTPEAVEAVRTVYPQLFARMTQSVMEKLTSTRGPVPYQSRLMLSMLLGTDLDGSLKPDFINRNQAAYGSGAKSLPSSLGPAGPAKAEKLTIASRSLTPMQRASARGDE